MGLFHSQTRPHILNWFIQTKLFKIQETFVECLRIPKQLSKTTSLWKALVSYLTLCVLMDIFLLVWYNELGIVYCTYLAESGYNSKKCIFCLAFFFIHSKQCRPRRNATICGISSGSSLFESTHYTIKALQACNIPRHRIFSMFLTSTRAITLSLFVKIYPSAIPGWKCVAQILCNNIW